MKVRLKGGKKVDFDRARFAKWLERNYDVAPLAAPKVARTVRQLAVAEIGDTVSAAELPRLAGRVLGRAASRGLRRTAGFDPTGLVPNAGDAVSLLRSIFEFLLSRLGDQGFVEDEKGYLKREQVGFIPPFDDQKAPEIRNVQPVNPGCCESSMGQKGVQFDLSCEVTDTGGVGNSSGVKKVRVCGVSVAADGNWFLGPCVEHELTDQEIERSEDEWVAVTVTLCVDCAFITDGVLPIMVHVTDDDDNDRICLTRVPFGMELRDRCCG